MEAALVLPLLILILALGTDAGRAQAVATVVHGLTRTAAMATRQASNSVGEAIRAGSPEYPDGVWGPANAGGQDAHCSQWSPGQPPPAGVWCGDPGACASGSGFWTDPGTTACFATGSCQGSTVTLTCGAITWGWPPLNPGASTVAVVRVCVRASPLIALSSAVLGSRFLVCDQDYVHPEYAPPED